MSEKMDRIGVMGTSMASINKARRETATPSRHLVRAIHALRSAGGRGRLDEQTMRLVDPQSSAPIMTEDKQQIGLSMINTLVAHSLVTRVGNGEIFELNDERAREIGV